MTIPLSSPHQPGSQSAQEPRAIEPGSTRPVLAPIPPPGPADRVRRLAWAVAWAVAARWTPVPLHGWRRMLTRLFGARIGRGVALYPSAVIWAPWNLVMEDGSCLAEATRCYNVAAVTIGRDAVVSQYAYLCTASHDPHQRDFPLVGAPIRIGAGAWVAAEAFVSPGVTLGDRAVAAARAVVVRDVGPGQVVGGNPARSIGHRGDS